MVPRHDLSQGTRTACGHALVPGLSWQPSCAQDLLDDPNPKSPAQADAYMLFTQKRDEYRRRVRAQAVKNPTPS